MAGKIWMEETSRGEVECAGKSRQRAADLIAGRFGRILGGGRDD